MSTNGKFNTKIQRKKKNPSEINANYCTKVMLQRKTSKAEVIGSHKREKNEVSNKMGKKGRNRIRYLEKHGFDGKKRVNFYFELGNWENKKKKKGER